MISCAVSQPRTVDRRAPSHGPSGSSSGNRSPKTRITCIRHGSGMTNENVTHTPATSTSRLTKAQRRTLRRREKRARGAAEAAKPAKGVAQLQTRAGGSSTAPAIQRGSANYSKEPQFPVLSAAARRALSRSTVSSTDIKAIQSTRDYTEAERQRRLAARTTELRRRKMNRILPKR